MKAVNDHPAMREGLNSIGIFEWGVGFLDGALFRSREDRLVFCVLLPYSEEQKKKKMPRCGVRSYIEPFAWNVDYHNDVRGVLNRLLSWLKESRFDFLYDDSYELCVDTSGYDDRVIAEKCGVGVRGRNGLIINRRYGTQHFIGYIVFSHISNERSVRAFLEEGSFLEMPPPCEGCSRCISACPTDALRTGVERCLSYITQSSDYIPHELREKMGDRLYGCSVCQLCCPHNFSVSRSVFDDCSDDSHEDSYVDPFEILALSNKEFKRKFGHMGFAWRPARIYKRNAVINIGNTGTENDITKLFSSSFNLPNEVLEYIEWARDRVMKNSRKSNKCAEDV